jgi:hypothetical protein
MEELKLDEKGFKAFMKKQRKSKSTISRCLDNTKEFEEYLNTKNKTLEKAKPKDLELFAETCIDSKKVSSFMWALSYYFLFMENNKLLETAESIRAGLLSKSRKPFKLKDFRGVKIKHIEALAKYGIIDTAKMLEVGKTRKQRSELAKKTGLDIDTILEFVKLSDLSRLPGVKGIRARLYHDAGIDSIEKLSKMTPEDVLKITREFIERADFDGIAPLPKETKSSIATAKKLPKIVEW